MGRAVKDLTGLDFGDLHVIERAGSTEKGAALWLCHCNRCGNDAILEGQRITSGKTDCGCKRRDALADLTGQTFGPLEVLFRLPEPDSHGNAQYLCRCELCGGEKVFPANVLRQGELKSCGCQQYAPERMKEMSKKGTEAAIKDGANIPSIINTRPSKNNKLGTRGVHYSKKGNCYIAKCTVRGETWLGYGYATESSAAAAYAAVKKALMDKYDIAPPVNMLTPAQFAEKHGVPIGRVYSWINNKRLSVRHIEGKRVLIPEDAEVMPTPPEVRKEKTEQRRLSGLRKRGLAPPSPAQVAQAQAMAEGMLTPAQFAEKHGVLLSTVRGWIDRKQLDVVRQKNGRVFIPADAQLKPSPPDVKQRYAEANRAAYLRKTRDKQPYSALQAALAEGRMLTPAQFAEKHGVPVGTVRCWISTHRLDVERAENKRVFIPADAQLKPTPPDVKRHRAEAARASCLRRYGDKQLPPAIQDALAEGRMLTPAQFAEKRGVHVVTVYHWISNHQLDVERAGGRVFIPADAQVKPVPPEVRQHRAEKARAARLRKEADKLPPTAAQAAPPEAAKPERE